VLRMQRRAATRALLLLPPQLQRQELLNAEITEDFRLCFVDGQQIVAGRAILGDRLAIFCGVIAIVAAEAARIAHVADVIRMGAPGNFHLREHVGGEDGHQSFAGGLHKLWLCRQHLGVFSAIKGGELLGNLGASLVLGCVIGLEQLEAFLVHPRQSAWCEPRDCGNRCNPSRAVRPGEQHP
jgi:hypothetical protein